MGFFGKLFEKKVCSVCGGEIGLLGNRKLEDGNLCKHCAAKLSPFFSDRRNSTVAEIQQQLNYRAENQKAVAAFRVTRTLGRNTMILMDEDARKFMVTDARNYMEANPDVIDFSMVTGCDLDIDEIEREQKREDREGNMVSYVPPRYEFSYDFHMIIRVNHPYFDEIKFRLNSGNVEVNPGQPLPSVRKPNPRLCPDYVEFEEMGREIKEILTSARKEAREQAAAAAAPKMAVTCPWCGATTMLDANGCCEYCGGSVNA